MMNINNQIPVWEKLNLTIEQAAEYSNIGVSTLRKYIKENPSARFILYVGKKVLIKRKEFDKWNEETFIVK